MSLFYDIRERKARVLFVCLGNSYRSRMAEAFANHCGGDVLEAASAGFSPAARYSRTARNLMREAGVDLSTAAPRRINHSELMEYDLIVNLCEYGLPKTETPVIKVVLPDPMGKPPEQQREIRDKIEEIVCTLIAQLRQARSEMSWAVPQDEPPPARPTGSHCANHAMLTWWRQRPSSAQLQYEGLPV